MTRKYLSLKAWYDKNTGLPKTILGEVTGGENKQGKPYQFTETDKTMTVEDFIEVGRIVEFQMTAVQPQKKAV